MTIQEFISKYEIWLPKNYRDELKKQITDDLEVMFEALRQPHVSSNASKEVKYCKDGKRICDCMGLVCSK